MKKVSLVSVLTVLIVLYFGVNSFAEFYVIPVTKNSYAPVARTGQTSSQRTHDDGDLEKGVQWPDPRFTDNEDGTVTDNLTGLVWLKKANYNSTAGGTGQANWNTAIDFCKNLNDGECGLEDGSSAGDWRLPNVRELQSLIDYSNYDLALPSNPFTAVAKFNYWTSTTYKFPGVDDHRWQVHMIDGKPTNDDKDNSHYVWPVRDGN